MTTAKDAIATAVCVDVPSAANYTGGAARGASDRVPPSRAQADALPSEGYL